MRENIRVEEYKGIVRIVGFDRDYLDLNKTFNCGQCFRWKQLGVDAYSGIVSNRLIIIKQMIFDDGAEGIVLSCDLEFTKKEVWKYFQFDTDYNENVDVKILNELDIKAIDYGKGIRILKQDPWKVLVSSIIYHRNNIKDTKRIIENMCKKYGRKATVTIEKSVYTEYMFPTPSDIVSKGIEGLRGVGLGHKVEYILRAAEYVSNGYIDLNKLESIDIDGDMANKLLSDIDGVGKAVSDRVSLFGLNKLEVFPLDFWIQKKLNTNCYTGIDTTKYGTFAGIMSQYMYYYLRNN